jgi:hypothetical protein
MAKSQDDKDIFDRSFKQIIGSLSSKALIHFINALFGSNHPFDSEVRRLNTEQIDKSLKKLQPDEIILVGGSTLRVELGSLLRKLQDILLGVCLSKP